MQGSRAVRLAKQRERSKRNRERRKLGKIPDRDDIARVALRWLLVAASSFGDPKRQFKLERHILDELVRLGFDDRKSEDVLEDLTEKYMNEEWDFLPKVHLR